MKAIVIFGATGNIGLFAIQAALKEGLNVRAFVRDPSKLPEDLRSKVEVVEGDVTCETDVQRAVISQDAVIVALGNRLDLGPTTILSDGMKNIISAMKLAKIELVSVCLSAFLFFEPSKVPAIFKNINDDHQRMFDCLKASNLKWIAVFPGHFTDESSGDYTVKHDASPGRTIAKQHLGAFLVECLSKPEHYNQVCGIATVTPPTTS